MKNLIKRLIRRKPRINTSQHAKLVQKMDCGNFNFSQEEENSLIKLWHLNNSTVPLPSKFKQIFDSQDAIYMNSFEAAELTFKLPYGIAYEQAQEAQYKSLIEWTLEHNIPLENKIVIDAGCGFGGLLASAYSKFPKSTFWGIECAQSAKERLTKKYPWLKVTITNIEKDVNPINNILPEGADVIYCTEVLEHLQQPAKAILNLLSLKKTRGTLILTVPNGRLDTASQHINFWSPESWKIFINDLCKDYKVDILKTLSPNAPAGHNLCAIIKNKLDN